MLKRLLSRLAAARADDGAAAAAALYRAIVVQSRRHGFYEHLAVPDTPDGRFDVLMVHAALVLRRLRRDHAATETTAQALFDLMFDDMDENLREMGVGDLAVGKRVKGMAQALYGRLAAYGEALDAGDRRGLADALVRNVYRAGVPAAMAVEAFAGYMFDVADHLEATATDELLRGTLAFPAAPAGGWGAGGCPK
ncbi:MAG: ubiquinol-cytochrome C chaperone family protein [Rhodospirillales bacterium]|nr:ubiquinol-cytochrome C chaperone family protein [Rhodospirillales bacterium]